ncbi:MAG TPA: sigma-70 family RNA polymerase sigma factor [Actinomycetota bacterium]
MTPPPFTTFLEEHRVPVYRFLLATVGPNDADDCFQETFLSALRAYPRLREDSNLRAWILTIATRKAADHGRARARRPVPVEEVPERAAPAPELDGTTELWAAVRALPPMQRAAVVHRYVLDLPYADIAAALGCTEEAARANAYAGRRKLREEQERLQDKALEGGSR